MLRSISFLSVGVLAVGVAVAVAVPPSDQKKPAPAAVSAAPSVGDFVVGYAAAMGVSAKSASPDQAMTALRKAGAIGTEPLDLSARLTEGDVVRVGGKHLRISSAAPERQFSGERMAEFFTVFGPEIRQVGRRDDKTALSQGTVAGFMRGPDPLTEDGGFDPHSKGKGKGKGTSPHEP